jgi:hypothetical protein
MYSREDAIAKLVNKAAVVDVGIAIAINAITTVTRSSINDILFKTSLG